MDGDTNLPELQENKDTEGRYRGFDIEDDDDPYDADNSIEKHDETVLTGETCTTTIEALQRTIDEQEATIRKLHEQIKNYAEDTEHIMETGSEKQVKKRKRDQRSIENIMEMTRIADSSDKDIKIRNITEENLILKELLAKETYTRRQVYGS